MKLSRRSKVFNFGILVLFLENVHVVVWNEQIFDRITIFIACHGA